MIEQIFQEAWSFLEGFPITSWFLHKSKAPRQGWTSAGALLVETVWSTTAAM
jgi:hypothetical protein